MWRPLLVGVRREVVLEHELVTGSRRVTVDGREVVRVDGGVFGGLASFLGEPSEDLFDVGEHRCAVRIRPTLLANDVDLVIDGVSMRSGRPVGPLRRSLFWRLLARRRRGGQ